MFFFQKHDTIKANTTFRILIEILPLTGWGEKTGINLFPVFLTFHFQEHTELSRVHMRKKWEVKVRQVKQVYLTAQKEEE